MNMFLVAEGLRRKLASKRGQNTVEYLLMLGVIVGVSLVIGRMFKPQISGVFNQVMKNVSDAANTVGRGE